MPMLKPQTKNEPTTAVHVENKMSFDDYQKMLGVNSHALIELADKTPAHCYQKYFAKDAHLQDKPTPAQTLGIAVHLMVLEPFRIADKLSVSDGLRRKSDDANNGRLVISEKDFQVASDVARAVLSNHDAVRLMSSGAPEQTLVVNRGGNLLPLKGRVDWLDVPNRRIVELKTSRDASPSAFSKQIMQYKYHISAAFYKHLAEFAELHDERLQYEHWFVVVETAAPYCVAVYRSSGDLLQEGRAQWQEALKRFDECWLANNFPGYESGHEIGLPHWARTKSSGMDIPLGAVEL